MSYCLRCSFGIIYRKCGDKDKVNHGKRKITGANDRKISANSSNNIRIVAEDSSTAADTSNNRSIPHMRVVQ